MLTKVIYINIKIYIYIYIYCLNTHTYIYVYISTWSIYLSIYLSIYISIDLSIYLFYPSIIYIYIYIHVTCAYVSMYSYRLANISLGSITVFFGDSIVGLGYWRKGYLSLSILLLTQQLLLATMSLWSFDMLYIYIYTYLYIYIYGKSPV